MQVLFFALFLFLCPVDLNPGDPTILWENEEMKMIDMASEEDGFHLLLPTKSEGPLSIVTFVHGYGALNPSIYGEWLKHLASNGHAVIYPRYQNNLFSPPTEEFVNNVTTGIKKAFEYMESSEIEFDKEQFYLAGHSYGGVIVSHLASKYESLGLPNPKVTMACEPGTGPFTGGVLEEYTGIDENGYLCIVVGDDDLTVGQAFGNYLVDRTGFVEKRLFIWQYAYRDDKHNISASHYEPYSINPDFDNGHENFTSKRALGESKLDLIDKQVYWKTFDGMIELSRKNANVKQFEKFKNELLKVNDLVGDEKDLVIQLDKD